MPKTAYSEQRSTGASAPRRPQVQRPSISVAPQKAPAASAMQFSRGDLVVHKAFGSGKIQNVTPMGGDLLLEIVFEGAGTKMMMAKTASQYLAKI